MPFLATTGLVELCDRSDENVLLGAWCIRRSRWTEWEGIRHSILPSVWDDRERFYAATVYLDELYERMLGQLAQYLNKVHRVPRSLRFWRILIGPWLLHHLHQFYDRYVHLEMAFSDVPNLRTVALDKQLYRVPRYTRDLYLLGDDDTYNLQMFSQLLDGMGHQFPEVRPSERHSHAGRPGGNAIRRALRVGATRVVQKASLGLSFLAPQGVWMTETYGVPPLPVLRRLSVRGFVLDLTAVVAVGDLGPVFDSRRRGLAELPGNGVFERALTAALPQNFPSLYLEGFKSAHDQARSRSQYFPSVLMSSVAWFYNESAKFLAAEAAEESGTRIVAAQHGGGYGLHRYNAMEMHEARIADTFLVWGWADPARPSQRDTPSPQLWAFRNTQVRGRSADRRRGILFITNGNHRYVYRLHSWPVGTQTLQATDWVLRFFAFLPARLRESVHFRPYADYDHGFSAEHELGDRFPEVRLSRGRYESAFADSRLAVIDHSGTSLLQAFIADIPTILYWDPRRWEARETAEPYFESFRKAGVLWDTPEDAASKVAEIAEDPRSWWQSPAVRDARDAFVARFALIRDDWAEHWAAFLGEAALLAENRKLAAPGGLR